MNRKSQAAMEFLITYGWSMFVVILAIAALSFSGVLDPTNFMSEKCEIVAGLECEDFNAQSIEEISTEHVENMITILLYNDIGQDIYDVTIYALDCVPNVAESEKIYIPEGATERFEIKNCGSMVAEAKFESDLKVEYDVEIEGETIPHVKYGNIVVMVNLVE